MKFILSVGMLFFALNSHSSVVLSKTYFYQPEIIEILENKVLIAQNRSDEMMNYPLALIIKDDLALWCPPRLPLSDGLGCSVVFDMGEVNGTKLTVKKDIDILGKFSEIKSKLDSLNPNSTDEHIHFGSIFSDETSEGSHYFCYGENSNWKCELFVREEL